MPPIVNPYLKRPAAASVPARMGNQSQKRNSLEKRTHKLASSNKRKARPGDQLTITGEVAFDATRDCPRCRAIHLGSVVPHRGHDDRCVLNKQVRLVLPTTYY